MMRPWQIVRIATIGAACLAIAAYAAYEARGIVSGPELIVLEPMSGAVLHKPTTRVTGSAERIVEITLDGRPIFVSEDGAFDEMLILSPGYNEALVEAHDRFGRNTSVLLSLVYEPET